MDSLAQVRVIEEETHVYELQIGANLNAEAERRAAAQAAREAARAAQIGMFIASIGIICNTFNSIY